MGFAAYRKVITRSVLATLLVGVSVSARPAYAALGSIRLEPNESIPRTQFAIKPSISSEEPVLLDADQIDYDRENEVVVATGAVEIIQGDTVMLADQLIYDRRTNIITAHGRITMLEASGNVYFSDDIELRDDMKSGVINQFKSRLLDDSMLIAARAERVDENVTELEKAVYSPCKVGCYTPVLGSEPLWQVRADHVRIDQKEQRVVYDDAFFELYGVPVIYTPYLSHATPGADNKSGLLIPEYQHSSNLGYVFKQPVYLNISPDKDVTLTPIYVSQESPVMAAEYRQAFDSGTIKFDGSITNPASIDANGNKRSGHDIRGHYNARGDFIVNPDTNAGFDIRRTSDDTYLRRYNFNQETLLTSRAYVENFDMGGVNDRSYGSIQGVAFQGLTTADQGRRIPVAMPLVDVSYQSNPGWNDSRLLLDGNALALQRQAGTDSKRISATAAWKLPYITADGQVIETTAKLRNDVYYVDGVTLPGGRNFDGTTGRTIPEASVLWRYPLISHVGDKSFLVEPVVLAAVSPGGGNPEKIPNEDSRVPEFTDTNLFSTNRFAGYDRVENGARVSYGVRGQAQLYSQDYIDWLVGQNYRSDSDNNFPFSNDPDSHASDYVGKLGYSSDPFTLAYRFRLDKQNFNTNRNEVIGGLNYSPIAFSVSYLSLDNDPVLATKRVVSGTAALALTENWSLTTSGARDLDTNETTSLYTGATFKNECINVSAVLGRDYTQDRDVESSTNFLIKLSLKNLN